MSTRTTVSPQSTASAPRAGIVLRTGSGLAGSALFLGGAVLTLGIAIVACLGVLTAALIQRRRGKRLTFLGSWITAAATCSHFQRPDFRVRNRIFATLRQEHRAVVLKTTSANLDALVSLDGATFWDEWRGRWLGVRLDRVSVPVLRDLLEDAWRLAAPKRLAASLDAVSKHTPRP